MKNFNKKHKKSNQTVNFDIDDLRKQLIKKPNVSAKSKSKSERKRR